MVIVKSGEWFEITMRYSHYVEEDRIFYESIGRNILDIESKSISEAEKEKQYVIVDGLLMIYKSYSEISLRLDKECGKLHERLGDIALCLEKIGEGLDEFERNAKNRKLFKGIFGVEPQDFSGD